MIRKLICTVLICLALCWHVGSFAAQPQPINPVQPGNGTPASTQDVPRMQLIETTFDLGEVLEGSIVSHDFIVWNIGTAQLKIDQVGPTCGCLKADFDETIPPGGEGRITLTVDFSDHEGPLERTVGVFTNDFDSPDTTLSIKGTAKPLLQVRPGDSIALGSGGKQVKKASIDIVTTGEPFHIRNVETDLKGKVDCRLETVKKDRHYRLNVANAAKAGTYSGVIKLTTDLRGKSTVTIRVTGKFENEIVVKPASLALGKLPSQKPVLSKKITVESNPRRSFKITRLSYDKKLLKVTSKPLPKNGGFTLEVRANLANVRSGPPLQTVLSIETDAAPNAPGKVEVRLYNSKQENLAARLKDDHPVR